jgi:hypothetical protein
VPNASLLLYELLQNASLSFKDDTNIDKLMKNIFMCRKTRDQLEGAENTFLNYYTGIVGHL